MSTSEEKRLPTIEEKVVCEDCLYWNDDLEECEIDGKPDENDECDDYS